MLVCYLNIRSLSKLGSVTDLARYVIKETKTKVGRRCLIDEKAPAPTTQLLLIHLILIYTKYYCISK